MPPPLALLLCTAFVLLLLRVERLKSPPVSVAVWIPTLWMLAIASKPLAVWFGVTGDNESGSLPDRLLLIGLSVAGIVVLAFRRFAWSRALRRHGWLLALLTYMFVSTLWSDITLIAFRRWSDTASAWWCRMRPLTSAIEAGLSVGACLSILATIASRKPCPDATAPINRYSVP